MKDKIYCLVGEKLRVLRDRKRDPVNLLEKPHLEEIEAASTSSPAALSEARDRPGRFEKGDPSSTRTGLAGGEKHSRVTEQRKREAATVGAAIDSALKAVDYPGWELVVSQPRLSGVLEHLSKEAKASLIKTHSGNWSTLPLAEIEERLLQP